jgi:fumarate reductase flavoprotein subunit
MNEVPKGTSQESQEREERESAQLSRRAFLRGAALTTVVAGAALTGCSPAAQDEPANTSTPNNETPAVEGAKFTRYENLDKIGIVQQASAEETVDFAIVGSGLTGLVAAMLTAEQDANAKILLIEKFSVPGGNGNFAEINAGGHAVTYEAARARALETVKTSTWIKDPTLLTSLYFDTAKNSAWLFDKHGILHDDTGMYYETRNGAKSMEKLISEINTDPVYANIEIRINTQATALLLDDDHTCTGVQVRANNSYTDVKAKAVLLATGGLATNLDLLSYYTGEDVQEKCIGIGVGQDGDGHLMVEQTAHGMCKSVYPTGMFHNIKGFSMTSPLGVAVALQPTNLYVNQNGLRYGDESALNMYPFIPAGKAIELEGRALSIFGQNQIKYFEENGSDTLWWYYYKMPTSLQADLETYASNEYVYKADTLEDLAKAMDVPVEAFVKTVEDYNANAEAGTGDPDLGKPAEFMIPLGDGPYYGFRMFSGVCQTNGGIRVDEFCRVTDPYFVPITGLYAGGISFSGLNGEVYSPGTSQAAALWSGSKVARYVVEEVLGGTVAPDWFGEKEYDGITPQREGKDPNKPLLGTEFA